jgi:hypothetical protein
MAKIMGLRVRLESKQVDANCEDEAQPLVTPADFLVLNRSRLPVSQLLWSGQIEGW